MARYRHSLVVIVILAILTSISFSVQAEMRTGLGVSDMNVVGFMSLTETKRFDVGRVYNTGDFNMTITATWIPKGNYDGINVTVIPEQMFLEPLVAETVYVEVLGLATGNYSGRVAFSCDVHLPPAYVGNPSASSGQVNARFIVQPEDVPEPQEESIMPDFPFDPTIALVVVGITCIVAVSMFAWMRRE